VQSFDWAVLRLVRAEEPRLGLNALTNTDYLEVDQPGASPWLAGIDIDDFDDSVPAAVSALGFDTVSPSHTILTPAMIEEAHEAGLRVLPQIGIYCVSKAAVVHMTKSMAVEWGRYNINVNAICPGYISTEINAEHFQSEQGRALVNMLPRKRVGEPQDLDGLLLLLASDEAHFINGAIMTADDGMSAS